MTPRQRERAASILLETIVAPGRSPGETDEEVAKKHGISSRTIRGWRKDLDTDPAFAELFQEKRLKVEQDWAAELPGAIRAAIKFLTDAASSERANIHDPATIHAIAGALKLLTEVATTKRILDVRLAKATRATGAPDRPVAAGAGKPDDDRQPAVH